MPSPSPTKSRKLSPAQQANSPPAVVAGSPEPHSVNISSAATAQSPSVLASPESGGSFSLENLFGGRHGSALKAHIIAHDADAQRAMDKLGIALGVQWELARGVSRHQWSWDEVKDKLNDKHKVRDLTGTNTEVAYKVPAIMRGRPEPEHSNFSVWKEIDREQKALLEGKSRGLGLMGPWEGDPDYYGGQVQYPLRLVKSDKPEGGYKIHLEKPEKGRSHRFGRDLGSASILPLTIPLKLMRDELEGDNIRNFLTQKFVICGRIFVPLTDKGSTTIYLLQTNENWERKSQNWFGDQYRLSFDEFIQRHNPPDLNSEQPFAKYTARYALGLSTSTPVLEFESHNIIPIPDIWAKGWDPKSKPPAEKIMTDGCGWINRSALLLITKRVGYESLPTAIQGRIGGAKGMWVLHPDDVDENPKIWIRDSQLKIKLRGDLRVHRILDLLRASRPSQTEARRQLSIQSILCLSSNGIPDDVFISLVVNGLEQTVKPLLDWSPGAMVSLWNAVNKAGNVTATRMQRIAGSRSRVLGFVDREWDKPDDEAKEDVEGTAIDTEIMATSSRWGRNDFSGVPLSLHEKALELIQAGFNPATSVYLNDAMRWIVKKEIESVVQKFKISLPESTASEAFVIPDPLGILKENEIYYRTSNPMKNPVTQTLFQILVGPVLVSSAYPIRLPCDMQLVTAVDVPELYNWPDVIIASTAGQRSLLSLLSGGDTVFFIWLETFLKNFRNQPFTPPPPDLSQNFERKVVTVQELGHQLHSLTGEEAQRTFQQHLLMGLRDTQVGLYSFFHDNAVWRHGYQHEKGNILLDAGKTGLLLDPAALERHKKAFGHERPRCFDHTKNWCGPRDKWLPPFILDNLVVAGQDKGDQLLREYDIASGKMPQEGYRKIPKDVDLLQPIRDVRNRVLNNRGEWSGLLAMELKAISDHVDKALQKYQDAFAIPDKQKQNAALLAMHQQYAEPIPQIGSMVNVDELKASYAYSLTSQEKFGFMVAFKTLCSVKARATSSGMAPVSRMFDEVKNITGSALRAMAQEVDDYD
ncbi:RNA dependent RNA polymerase-domain-containing protein [Mycena sp. CBHHK59/15]|nr:RNA dependent RNA polymerase-domain-containing protein [Mycena sp. CBHHK59/15]